MASAHIAPAHIEAFKPQACQVGLNQRFAVGVILCVQGYALVTQSLQTKDTSQLWDRRMDVSKA